MNDLAKKGKTLTLITIAGILSISIYMIVAYQMEQTAFDWKKFGSQCFWFLMTVGLLSLVYKGKKWAVILSLFILGLFAIASLVVIAIGKGPLEAKILMHVILWVYGWALYHFGKSKAYRAFYKFQRGEGS